MNSRTTGGIRQALPLMCFVFAATACTAAPVDERDPGAELLEIHEQVLEAHRTGDVDLWMGAETDEFVSANAGSITFPTLAERRAMREPYLRSTTFDVYRDVTEPVVEVSPDGQLGWVIVQVEVAGTQIAPDSSTASIQAVWAWIELYRKVDGQWKLVGNVSNRQN
ncbi:MAG TPA: nuclear transport factor 2 family protein [Vicinamibacterales bacterium]|nr:nuclear transport factor 2 family protein [Vicinamibacterales bacterium]